MRESPDLPLFAQTWWLDAVAPEQWREVTVTRGDEIAARWPYAVHRRFGGTMLTLPPLTPQLGPWLRPSTAGYAKQLAEQKDLIEQLVAKLPRHDLFHQNLPPEFTNWLPLHWSGFTLTPRMTYRITALDDLDAVWGEFRANIRTDVRKADKQLELRDDLGAGRLVDLLSKTFDRQARRNPYDATCIERVCVACAERQQGQLLFAVDASERVHAATLIVWDGRAAYYLLSGADPEHRNSGAGSFLVWHAIQLASRHAQMFDFEGSMVEPIERFVRAFGARQTPYVMIRRMGRKMRAFQAVRDLARALGGR